MKTILCSTGTSIAKDICNSSKLLSWIENNGGVDKASILIFEKIRNIEPEGINLQKQLSAEIHSLKRIGVCNDDRVILLASETDDGLTCAYAVKEYLEFWYKGIEVNVKLIQGLQVKDAKRFKQEGVVNFVKQCLETINDYGTENVILNPTGGFKALVAYTVLVGMLKGVSCRYIFEQSTTLLELPPLLVSFDRSRFESYHTLFDDIERKSSISIKEFENNVPYEDQSILEPMIEREDKEITLSAFGHLLLNEFRQPTSRVPFLSRIALDECLNNLRTLKQCDPFRFLNRVARDKSSFRKSEHKNMKNGMRWLKPGNTTDRYLVSIEDWRLLVWHAIREDEVGSDYLNKVVINKPKEERKKYAPFIRMEIID